MITAEQIKQAEGRVEQTARELDTFQRRDDRGALSAKSKLDDAWKAHTMATRRLELLRKDFEAEAVARTEREAAGRAAAEAMGPTSRGLTQSREAAVKAVAAARTAIVQALAAVAAHDAAVRAASAELSAKGLRVDDNDATGSRADGGVHIGGEKWLTTDGPAVLVSVLTGAVAEVQPRHPLARSTQITLTGLAAVAGRDDLLARLPRATRKAV